MSLPKYINSRSIAEWLGPEWRRQRIQRILKQMGIARKIGQSIVVTPEDLAGEWPEVYELLLERIEQIPVKDHGHVGAAWYKRRKKRATNCEVVRKDCVPECGESDLQSRTCEHESCEYEVGAGWSCRHKIS